MTLLHRRRGIIGAAGALSYKSVVLADSPVAYYPLTDTSGTTATDESGNARHGTYYGSPALATRTVGTFTGVADFDGTDDYIATPAIADPGWTGITFECWAVFDAAPNGQGLISEVYTGHPDPVKFNMGVGSWAGGTGTSLGIASYNGSAWASRTAPQPASATAYHFVGTFNASTALGELWQDGVKVASGSLGAWQSDSDHFLIGRGHTASTSKLNGAIAHVAIYGQVLADDRIAAHHAAGL